MARGLANIDAVVRVGGVADNAFVLLVEGVHRSPGKRDPVAQHAGMVGQGGVLPGRVVGVRVSDPCAEPRGIAEVAVLGLPTLAGEDTRADVGGREICDRVAAGFVEEDDILAVGDPLAGELHAHPSAQRLGEEQSLRERLGGEEAPHRGAAQRALLPGKSHRRAPFVEPRRRMTRDGHVQDEADLLGVERERMIDVRHRQRYDLEG